MDLFGKKTRDLENQIKYLNDVLEKEESRNKTLKQQNELFRAEIQNLKEENRKLRCSYLSRLAKYILEHKK